LSFSLPAENHATELAKLETQRLTDHDALKATEKELQDLQGKFSVTAEEIEELKISLQDASRRHRNLELFVLAHCQKIMGKCTSFLFPYCMLLFSEL
jgi:predicted  nucleic acid-binding Zn-ribbon protein